MYYMILLTIFGLFVSQAEARTSYRGYSGAPGRQTCAASCHGQSGGSVQVTGFPETYTPGQTYQITIQRLSGSSINQFNGSCRIGTGSTNAGTLSAGTGTSVYNVSGETNGICLSSSNQTSATFNWTAPAAGTGTVRLYIGAYQGTSRTSGQNTTLVQISNEATVLQPPEAATAPSPANAALGILPTASLSWTAGARTVSHDLYLGSADSLNFITNLATTETEWQPPVSFTPGQTFYWRIDERNDAGATAGEVWHFSVLPLPEPAYNPLPADASDDVPTDATLHWNAGANTASHNVYLGLTQEPGFVAIIEDTFYQYPFPLLPDTVYYWRVDETNDAGTTAGSLWSFRTAVPNAAAPSGALIPNQLTLGPVYPNPFNARVTIPFVLPNAARISLTLWDISGRQVAVLSAGNFSAGVHRVEWSSANVGSGIYFLRLTAGGHTATAKVVSLK